MIRFYHVSDIHFHGDKESNEGAIKLLGKVRKAFGPADRLLVTVDDPGASVPAKARADLVWRRIDPASIGRPRGTCLLCATAFASRLGGSLVLDEAPGGGTRVQASLPTGSLARPLSGT